MLLKFPPKADLTSRFRKGFASISARSWTNAFLPSKKLAAPARWPWYVKTPRTLRKVRGVLIFSWGKLAERVELGQKRGLAGTRAENLILYFTVLEEKENG